MASARGRLAHTALTLGVVVTSALGGGTHMPTVHQVSEHAQKVMAQGIRPRRRREEDEEKRDESQDATRGSRDRGSDAEPERPGTDTHLVSDAPRGWGAEDVPPLREPPARESPGRESPPSTGTSPGTRGRTSPERGRSTRSGRPNGRTGRSDPSDPTRRGARPDRPGRRPPRRGDRGVDGRG
ncbi:hypothetical protein HNR16_002779 [Pseudoclavibacter chungangensis]|nr:hypothetical protein [Pseudoclavibacter chungangensis]